MRKVRNGKDPQVLNYAATSRRSGEFARCFTRKLSADVYTRTWNTDKLFAHIPSRPKVLLQRALGHSVNAGVLRFI